MSIVRGYRDENGKSKTKTVKSIGFLDELQNTYENPIEHFEAEARQMNDEHKTEKTITFAIDMDERIDKEIGRAHV